MTKKAEVEPVVEPAVVVDAPPPGEVSVLFSDDQIDALKKGGKLILTPAQVDYLRAQLGYGSNIGPDGHVIDMTKA